MIQRIQSVFLLIAALALGGMFYFPFAISDTAAPKFLSDMDYDIYDHIMLMIVTALGIALAFITIFLYKNRKLQLRLGYLLIVFGFLLPLLAYLLFANQADQIPDEARIQDRFGMYLPLIAILFTALANYFIRKDEKLVRSMDRLR